MADQDLPLALTFDDVLLMPGRSAVHPAQVDVTSRLTRAIRLNIPILSAAMDTVTEAPLAIAMAQHGGLGVIHRNMPIARQAEEVDMVKRSESGMIVDPVTIRPDRLVREALDQMARFRISGLPVVDEHGQLKGILTNRDLRFCTEVDRPIADFMTKEHLVTAPVGTTLEAAKALLHKHRIEKLLVVDDEGNLKGLITVKDIKKAQEYPNACKDALGRLRVAAAVGAGTDLDQRCAALVAAKVDLLCLDSSHGHSEKVLAAAQRIKERFPEVPLMAGNVATFEGARDLIALGVDAVKVGVGPGSICTTRVVTGAGVPQITAILECARACRERRRPADRRRRHQVLRRHHQGARRRRRHGHDRVAVRGGGRVPGRTDPLPGAHVQGVPRHGLPGRDEDRRGRARPVLPERRGALQAGARGDRGHGAVQGTPVRPAHPVGRRAALGDGALGLRHHRAALGAGPLHAHHLRGSQGVPRARRRHHQGSTQLPGRAVVTPRFGTRAHRCSVPRFARAGRPYALCFER